MQFLFRALFYLCLSVVAVACPKESQGFPRYVGHDFLGLGNKNFAIEPVRQALKPDSAIGVFDSTWPDNFGDPYPKVKLLLQTGKVKLVRVQLYWSYQHVGAPLKIVSQAVGRWEQLAREYPDVIFYLSPSCEYAANTPKSLVESWIKVIRNRAPHTRPVLSPMPGAFLVTGVLPEQHGDKVKNAKAVSLDGQNFFDANSRKLLADNKDAEYFLGWGLRYNLAQAGTMAKPPFRTAAPDFNYIESINALYHPYIAGSLKYPQLYKTHAEDKAGTPDARANRPLFIIKERAAFIEILDWNNKLLGKFPYYGTYLDQGYRYYSGSPGGMGKYGWQIGELARERTGSDAIKIRVNGKIYPVGSAWARTPYYQK